MRILDLTFRAAAENLACDEALLDLCEEGLGDEVLRFWSPANYFVVLGYSNKADAETRPENCRKNGIPVLRRCSGGGTVLQGPGCLNYSVVLKLAQNENLKNILSTNRFIMERHRKTMEDLLRREVCIQGSTDLTLGNLKFSGNAQRRKRKSLLFHGTFLLGFDISMIEKTLAMPSKEPAYRKNREHREFLTNLQISQQRVKQMLKKIWGEGAGFDAGTHSRALLQEKIRQLVKSRYSSQEWNLKF